MNIRQVKVNDLPKLDHLFRQIDILHSDSHPEIFSETEKNPRSLEFLTEIIDNDQKMFILSEENNEYVGMAIAEIETAPDIALFTQRKWLLVSIIVVDENYKGKGLGSKLLESLLNWAKKNKVNEVELTVFSFNQTAINFYEKHGFKTRKQRMHKYIR